MDNYFVWIIPADLYNDFKRDGVSPTYVVPANMMGGRERRLVRSGLWLVVRGRRDEVAAFIKPRKIEKFTDAYYNGDYLLHANLSSSFRIGSPGDNVAPALVGAFDSLPL